MQPGARRVPIVLGWTVALLVACSPALAEPFWTPKAAILLFALCGLALVPQVWRVERNAAAAGLAFLSWAVICTATATNVVTSIVGLYLWGTGLVFLACLYGCWLAGVSIRHHRARLELALLGAAMANCVVAWVTTIWDLRSTSLARNDTRAAGLLANPLQLAGLLAALQPLLLVRWRADPKRWTAPLILVWTAMIFTGSRWGLLLAIVGLVMGLRGARARQVVIALSLVLASVACAQFVSSATGSTTVATRTAGPDTRTFGYEARLENWWSARHAVAQRPVTGIGPGNYRSAVSPYRTAALVIHERPDYYFADAHNLLVETTTTMGVPGVALLAVWLGVASRRAAGPMRAFSILLLANHLFSPQFVGTTPLAWLALGAASVAAGDSSVERSRRPTAVAAAVIALAVAAAGARLLYSDHLMHEAELDYDIAAAEHAAALTPFWPTPQTVVGRIRAFQSINEPPALAEEYVAASRRAVELDPESPFLWNNVGSSERYLSTRVASASAPEVRRRSIQAFERALELDPWSAKAMKNLVELDGDTHSTDTYRARLRRLGIRAGASRS
jgi:hypothetical protein